MEPEREREPQSAYRERTAAAGWSPSAAGWSPPGNYREPEGAPPVRRVRSWLVVLVAVLVELVLIGGADNQWASRKIADAIGIGGGLGSNAARSWLVYRWRIGAASGDAYHGWVAELALVGTVVVLSALLVWVIARGVVGFGRVFVGSWLAVIVATQVGVIVAGLVVDPGGRGIQLQTTSLPRRYAEYVPLSSSLSDNRLDYAVFGAGGPGGTSFVAGLGLGLLVALAAAIVAVAARRTVGAVVPVGAGYLPAEEFEQAGALGPEHTAQLPAVNDPGPYREPDPYRGATGTRTVSPPGHDDAPTTQLPPYARDPRDASPDDATSNLPPVRDNPYSVQPGGAPPVQPGRAQPAGPATGPIGRPFGAEQDDDAPRHGTDEPRSP